MSQRSVFCLLLVLLVTAVAFSGCTTQQAAPATPAATTIATPAAPPSTLAVTAAASPEKTTVITKTETKAAVEKVILNTKGMISPTEYKIYDFKSMGDEFSKVGERYKITLKADKPVIGYAVTSTQASELAGNELIPQYVAGSDKIQWGLITPYMVIGKVTSSTETFTVETVNPYVYVVDARWMGFDNDYKTSPAFNYTLTIAKITAPETAETLIIT
jgi:hypothetical protein